MPELKKFDEGKSRVDLIPPAALVEIGRVFGYGAKKYGAWNHRAGTAYSRYTAALLRHIYAWQNGEDLDPESGLHHLAHAACNLLILLDFIQGGWGIDDRPPRYTEDTTNG